MSPVYRAGVREITSSTLTITKPRGPVANIEGGSGGGNAFDLSLSFGHGTGGVDDVLPDDAEINSFWLSPTTSAAIATPGQVREWPTRVPLQRVGMDVEVDVSDIVTDDPYRLNITVDGLPTGAFVEVPGGPQSGLKLSAFVDVLVAAGSTVGVQGEPGNGFVSGTLRAEVKVYGVEDTSTGPYVAESLRIWRETLPTDPAYEPVVDEDGFVTTWPNRGSAGVAGDLIAIEGTDSFKLEPTGLDGTRPAVASQGVDPQVMQMRADAAFTAANVSGHFGPFHRFCVIRLRTLLTFRYVRVWKALANPISPLLPLPIAGTFKLCWQYFEDAASNVNTVPDLTGDILDQLVIVEWVMSDEGHLSFLLNGETVELAGHPNDPQGPYGAAQSTFEILGSDDVATDFANGADMGYDATLTSGQRAKTYNDLRSRYFDA